MRVMVNGPLVGPSPAGPGVHLRELLRAMLAERVDLEIVTRHASFRKMHLNRESAARIHGRVESRTTPIPSAWLNKLQVSCRAPAERLLAGRFDVYHQLHTDSDPAVPGDQLVITLHDTVALRWPTEEGAMFEGAGALLRRAAAVITVSKYSRLEICNAFGLDPAKVYVIANGIDPTRFTPTVAESAVNRVRERIGVGGPFLLHVGGGTPRKNLPGLLAAFRILLHRGDHPDLVLVLAGPATAELDRWRAQLGDDAGSLVGAGYVPDSELPGLYRAAEVLIAPGFYEGFGIPALEAMACGTPVVSSRTGALPEVVGGAGILVDPGDPASIADGVETALGESAQDRSLRVELGISIAGQFTWARAARSTLEVYERVMCGSRERVLA